MKTTWTVYTAELDTFLHEGQADFKIVATPWSETGPDTEHAKVKARLHHVTRAEADRQAAEMQQAYDRVRRTLTPA